MSANGCNVYVPPMQCASQLLPKSHAETLHAMINKRTLVAAVASVYNTLVERSENLEQDAACGNEQDRQHQACYEAPCAA